MPRGLVILVSAALAAAPALGFDPAAALDACRGERDDAQRLACYDRLAARKPVVEHRGAGNRILPLFDLSKPTRLVFESMDAIMVVYLLDASGAVIQNLHQAGTGSGSFLIERPGRYGIQVNASGGWLIRLEEPG
ncbi:MULTISPECIES: hypothetical protein [Paracoccus]|uniref:Uncharacterized protein n=1 Tax=Paracoccus kondratievae TaxID=135740 RepID=A0AAD3RUF1_9RHOB|nr:MULTISPECIES: hypothetical protein [Paracoccus]GLK64742.1 hypothetical protein GCM10017635_22130 [Paracoccus kondratievae]SMG47723.1 hypothetical protein SAMN02746000_02917 [Paracoccus sp. J56]